VMIWLTEDTDLIPIVNNQFFEKECDADDRCASHRDEQIVTVGGDLVASGHGFE